MFALLRHRSPLLIRLLVLAVITFGSAGGALASALGELHALAHAKHGHADHVGVAHGAIEGESGHADDDLGARLLHALVHCGHCHGQGGMLAFAAPGWELMPALARVDAGLSHASWLPAPLESLLRPPIRG